MTDIDERFTAYVRDRGEHHLRVAVLLTGDWHAAEDLVQASLVKLHRACAPSPRSHISPTRLAVRGDQGMWEAFSAHIPEKASTIVVSLERPVKGLAPFSSAV